MSRLSAKLELRHLQNKLLLSPASSETWERNTLLQAWEHTDDHRWSLRSGATNTKQRFVWMKRFHAGESMKKEKSGEDGMPIAVNQQLFTLLFYFNFGFSPVDLDLRKKNLINVRENKLWWSEEIVSSSGRCLCRLEIHKTELNQSLTVNNEIMALKSLKPKNFCNAVFLYRMVFGDLC